MGPQPPHDENDSELLEKLSEYLPASTTRVETALSRFPIHNLSNNESIAIRINRKGQGGDTEISWSVSPSRDYGEPRTLAYRLDTLVINRRIDEAPRPLPRLLRLGSLRAISRELDTKMNGTQADALKNALYQNAFAGITAKVSYKTPDGRTKRFEKGFTRYSVYFKGEELPNGGTADAVYIYLNEDYWQVLNNAVFRPLDYEYQKGLPPSHQRFYELVSFAIFAALSKRRDEAKLVYSDYCLRAPQKRHFTRDLVQKQMGKLHRSHKEAGYIEKKIRYRQITDLEGQSDWEIFYTPGPRARAQYAFFKNRQKNEVIEVSAQEEHTALLLPEADPRFVDELVKRGVSPVRAKKLVTEVKADDELLDLLEWGDHLVGSANGKIKNPAGFYIYLIQDWVLPPQNFETTRLKKLREAAQQRADEERSKKVRQELAYQDYQEETIDRYMAKELPSEEYAGLFDAKRKYFRKTLTTLPEETIQQITRQAIRQDLKMAGKVPFITFEEFERIHHPDQLTLLPV